MNLSCYPCQDQFSSASSAASKQFKRTSDWRWQDGGTGAS